jgi:hypothetical protein
LVVPLAQIRRVRKGIVENVLNPERFSGGRACANRVDVDVRYEVDDAGALRAVRQCPRNYAVVYLSYFLREEGRLAALVGDSGGAIKAYRHYLTLRYQPGPSVKPEVERVRAELAVLESGSNGGAVGRR